MVNVHGVGCVLGHSFGASKTRIMATRISAMGKCDAKTGVASLCMGGGEASAVCLRRNLHVCRAFLIVMQTIYFINYCILAIKTYE